MGGMNSPTSGILYYVRRLHHLGAQGCLRGALATSVPDANQVGWGGTGGDKPLDSLVAYAGIKHHLAGACVRFLICLMKFAECGRKTCTVSHFFLECTKKTFTKFTL